MPLSAAQAGIWLGQQLDPSNPAYNTGECIEILGAVDPAAFERAATAYALPAGTQWEWPALRSNGSTFTARTLSLYFVHDIRHHLWGPSSS